jgi:serine acetyltransferase
MVPEKFRNHSREEDIEIGVASCLGAHSTILPGVVIPSYTSLGAGCIVVKQVPLRSGAVYTSRSANLIATGMRDIDKLEETIRAYINVSKL